MGTCSSQETEIDNSIHFYSMRVMKISAILNLINIIYDIILFAISSWIPPDWIGIIQTIISICGSIIFGLSTTVAALYGSKTIAVKEIVQQTSPSRQPPTTIDPNSFSSSPRSQERRKSVVFDTNPTSPNINTTPARRGSIANGSLAPPNIPNEPTTNQTDQELSIFYQLYYRWKHTEPKQKALQVNMIMEAVVLSPTSALYESVYSFRETIRSHMLSRMGLSGLLNLMTTIFLYFNVLIYIILYTKILKLDSSSTRLLYLMLNIVNPLVCLAISYIVVLCDNFNSLVVYARKVSELLGSSVDKLTETKQTIESLTRKIEKPLHHQLWTED